MRSHQAATSPWARWSKPALVLMLSVRFASPAAASAPPEAPAELRESRTGTRFLAQPRVDGVSYHCLGTGVRKIFTFKAYAVVYCVGNPSTVTGYVRQKYPDLTGDKLAQALRNDQGFYQVLAKGPRDRMVTMHMVRDVSRDKLAKAFSDSLENVLPEEKIGTLVAAVPGDVKKGEQAILYSRAGTLVISIGGKTNRIDDPQIADALWSVWLGPEGVSPTLKDSLAKEVARQAATPPAVGGTGRAPPGD